MLFSEVGLAWQVQCICDGQKANLKAIHVESRASLGPTSARELIKVIARTDAEERESYLICTTTSGKDSPSIQWSQDCSCCHHAALTQAEFSFQITFRSPLLWDWYSLRCSCCCFRCCCCCCCCCCSSSCCCCCCFCGCCCCRCYGCCSCGCWQGRYFCGLSFRLWNIGSRSK